MRTGSLMRRTPSPCGYKDAELTSPEPSIPGVGLSRLNHHNHQQELHYTVPSGCDTSSARPPRSHRKIRIRPSPNKQPAAVKANSRRHGSRPCTRGSKWPSLLTVGALVTGMAVVLALTTAMIVIPSISCLLSASSQACWYAADPALSINRHLDRDGHRSSWWFSQTESSLAPWDQRNEGSRHHPRNRHDKRSTLQLPTFFNSDQHGSAALQHARQAWRDRHHHAQMKFTEDELQLMWTQQAMSSSSRPAHAKNGEASSSTNDAPSTLIPNDFDAQTYLRLWPDLASSGITTRQRAKEHFLMHGQREGRVYRPFPLLVRYTSCSGLINQHYSHIAGIALAVALQAQTVIVPPGLARDSFAKYYSTIPHKNEVVWRAEPFNSMWDAQHLEAALAERKPPLAVQYTSTDATLPNLLAPESAFATTLPPNITSQQVVQLGGVHLQNKALSDLVATAQLAASQAASKATQSSNSSSSSSSSSSTVLPILLDLPCTMFAIKVATAPDLMLDMVRSLRFAPAMLRLADKVEAAMAAKLLQDAPAGVRPQLPPGSAAVQTPFNGLHLRLEMDAKDWAQILGGKEVLVAKYLATCQEAGFAQETALYLASGLSTYGDRLLLRNVTRRMGNLSSSIVYKEQFLSKDEMDDLHSEQTALVDFLVLARASKFVGISVSTFSHFLREYRVLQGLARGSSMLVDASYIGTDALFADAGTVVGNALIVA